MRGVELERALRPSDLAQQMADAEERAAGVGAGDPDGAVLGAQAETSGRAGGAGTVRPQDCPGAPVIAMARPSAGHVVAIGRRMPLRRSSSSTRTAAAVFSAGRKIAGPDDDVARRRSRVAAPSAEAKSNAAQDRSVMVYIRR